ncbi:MAG: hypothetical protein QOF01_5347 [Thermomicrobiales bacterium]|nr:hypothetical protein [Thermomicrobiales bacterium]
MHGSGHGSKSDQGGIESPVFLRRTCYRVAGLLPGRTADDEAGDAVELARVIGEHVVAVGEGGGGDDEVMDANRSSC